MLRAQSWGFALCPRLAGSSSARLGGCALGVGSGGPAGNTQLSRTLKGHPQAPPRGGLSAALAGGPAMAWVATYLQQGLVCREADSRSWLQGAAVLPPAQHGRGHGLALALQGHGLVDHNRHIQLFSEDAGRHCGGAGKGLSLQVVGPAGWPRPAARSQPQGRGGTVGGPTP